MRSLKIYGDGPLRERLTWRLPSPAWADRIELVGRVERTELAQAFTRADIYLQTRPPSPSAFHPGRSGLAVVAMRSSGVRDFIIDGVDGLLADDDAD